MKNNSITIFTTTAIKHLYILLNILFFLNQNLYAQQNNMPQKTQTSKPILVQTQPIKKDSFKQQHSYIGTLYFTERSSLASEISGIIEKILVNQGDKVKKNQPLAVLNSDLLQREILTKESLLEQAKVLFAKSNKEFERYNSLYKSDSIAYKEYEDSLFNLQAQKANMEAIDSELQLLKAQLKKKTIRSPYDGIILEKILKVGEWVNTGSALFSIARVGDLEASIEVPFEILQSLKINQTINTIIANQSYLATITAIIPLGDSKARTFPIKLSIKDSKGVLAEGLEVKATFEITQSRQSLSIPRDSILPKDNGYVIFVARGEVAKEIPISIQGYEGTEAYIQTKDNILNTKDKVIIRGHERLRDGQTIRESQE
ncbi:MAG: efflux RND transporter periplasmic adaptor subunit [Helicobacter sp.]|nr:efflux RND transporter periplasmic adaptor subunit [Helicobacter sp.]